MSKDLCKECDALIPAQAIICPVCGLSTETKESPEQTDSESYVDLLQDQTSPSYYQGL